MNITELLITGYDGEEAIFAVSLSRDTATVALTSTDEGGDTVVDSTWQRATPAFVGVRELIEELTLVPA